jgi:hypothetical protein
VSDNKLILHPQDPNIGIADLDRFVSDLGKIGLIGNKYADHEFQIGEKFLELIDFVQHRRAILLDKSGTRGIVDSYTGRSIEVVSYGEQISLHGVNSYMQDCYLRCPSCQFEQDINVVYNVLSTWHENQKTYRWHCEQCAESWHVYELNWHDGFAFARCAIDIWHIHYDEAVPTQPLLEFLKNKTGGDWTYFYYRI